MTYICTYCYIHQPLDVHIYIYTHIYITSTSIHLYIYTSKHIYIYILYNYIYIYIYYIIIYIYIYIYTIWLNENDLKKQRPSLLVALHRQAMGEAAPQLTPKLMPAAALWGSNDGNPRVQRTERCESHGGWASEILHQLIQLIQLVTYPTILDGFRHVSTIQGGAGFLPSTLCWEIDGKNNLSCFVMF